MSKFTFGGTWVQGGIPDVVSFIVFSNSKSMFSSRGFHTHDQKKEFPSLWLHITVHIVGYIHSHMLDCLVCAANLMQYCIESFCLRRYRGSSFASVSSDSTGDDLKAPSASRRPWCAIGSNICR